MVLHVRQGSADTLKRSEMDMTLLAVQAERHASLQLPTRDTIIWRFGFQASRLLDGGRWSVCETTVAINPTHTVPARQAVNFWHVGRHINGNAGRVPPWRVAPACACLCVACGACACFVPPQAPRRPSAFINLISFWIGHL